MRLQAAAHFSNATHALHVRRLLRSLIAVSKPSCTNTTSGNRLLTGKQRQVTVRHCGFVQSVSCLTNGNDSVPVNKQQGGTVMTDQLYDYLLSHTREHEVGMTLMLVQPTVQPTSRFSSTMQQCCCRFSSG